MKQSTRNQSEVVFRRDSILREQCYTEKVTNMRQELTLQYVQLKTRNNRLDPKHNGNIGQMCTNRYDLMNFPC